MIRKKILKQGLLYLFVTQITLVPGLINRTINLQTILQCRNKT